MPRMFLSSRTRKVVISFTEIGTTGENFILAVPESFKER